MTVLRSLIVAGLFWFLLSIRDKLLPGIDGSFYSYVARDFLPGFFAYMLAVFDGYLDGKQNK